MGEMEGRSLDVRVGLQEVSIRLSVGPEENFVSNKTLHNIMMVAKQTLEPSSLQHAYWRMHNNLLVLLAWLHFHVSMGVGPKGFAPITHICWE